MSRTADKLVEAVMLDVWPSYATNMDYGLDEKTYPVYQKLVRAGELTADQLHQALMQDEAGPALTELVRNCPSNPDPNFQVKLIWDQFEDEEEE